MGVMVVDNWGYGGWCCMMEIRIARMGEERLEEGKVGLRVVVYCVYSILRRKKERSTRTW
jgi:hypothetical protein